MKKHLKYISLMLSIFMIIGLFAGCKKSGEKTKITVSEVTHSVFYAPQYVAINKGFFAEEGLELEITNGAGADKVMTAVLSGHIDIGFAGPEAAIYVYNEGKADYTEVFAQMTKRDGSFLMGRTNDGKFDWNEVKGKTILPGRKGGVPYMTLLYVLRKNKIEPNKDVKLDDSIQFALMAGAFASGTGDFVTLFEPTATAFEKEKKGYILSSIGQESGEIPYTAYFAKKSFIQKNANTIQKFTNAVYRGQQWVMEHNEKEIAEAIAPSFPDTKLEILEAVVKRYKEIDVWSSDPVLKEESFELLQTVMSDAGELKQKAPYDKLVNNKFANKAIKIVK